MDDSDRSDMKQDKINFVLCRTIYKQITLAWGYKRLMKCDGYVQMMMK